MSTRSVVARVEGNGFKGRYCHWDGYPTCRGAQIWQTYRELDGDVEALLAYCLKPDQKGTWSSFGTPSDEAAKALIPKTKVCEGCKGTKVRPLDQYKTVQDGKCNYCSSTGVQDVHEAQPGWNDAAEDWWVTSSGSDCGTEWAYVISDTGLSVFDRRYGSPESDDGKMVGMFGFGAEDGNGYWKLVGHYQWEEGEPDWDAVENYAQCQEEDVA